MKSLKTMMALAHLAGLVGAAHGEANPSVRVSRPRPRVDAWHAGADAQRRAICLGLYRPKLPPRGMPAPGRLFKGHRP